MAEFLTSRKWSEIAGKTAKEISQYPCVEITDEEGNMLGEFGTFLMIPRNDYIQAQMDARGQVSNAFYVPPEAPLYVSDKPAKPKRKKKKRLVAA